jgi:hypothetical protein
MKKHLFTLIVLLFALVILAACSGAGPGADFPERSYDDGQKALAAENYAEASAAFEKAASYEDADRLLVYAKAWQALENADFASAAEGFRSLGDFKDCALMVSYCLAREQEALAQAAFSSDDTDAALRASAEAVSGYTSLSLFRDSDARVSDCRSLIEAKSKEWMNAGRWADAAAGFDALGGWQNSNELAKYCRASLLLEQGSRVEAAALFSEIPDVLDSAAKAETARDQAYQAAVELRDHGDPLAAVDAFRELGDYRDAREQAESTTVLLIRSLLASGSYAESLQNLSQLSDPSVFPAADAAEAESVDVFLKTFIGTWLNAHARVMNGFFSRSLLQSYIEPGGELAALLQAELPDDLPAENYGFTFNQDGQVESLLKLDDGFIAARVHGTGSSYGDNASGNPMSATLWVLLDTRGYYPVALAALQV